MNRRLISISLFICAVLSFSSCKKEDSGSNSAASLNSGQSQVNCTVSGAASSSFKSNTMISTVLKSTDLINISGSALVGTSAQIVMIILPANATTTTYTSKSNNSGDFAFSFSDGSTGWAADSDHDFSVVVTKVTATEIEGTFSGTLVNDDTNTQVTVKDGSFAAKF
ncbi:MAG: hypothetical protein HXX13_13435 [Bacteroidetes bacterium]|nr:hypothetical protein [Bacteroidota bacterium]